MAAEFSEVEVWFLGTCNIIDAWDVYCFLRKFVGTRGYVYIFVGEPYHLGYVRKL